jgi:hypothetical protein
MTFNYTAAITAAKEKRKHKTLEAIVLGPSGAGKSSLAGTIPGKVLYLFGSGETHGPDAAETYGNGNLDAICIDDGRTADEAFELLVTLLRDKEFLKKHGYTGIVIDSATEMESIIRNTSKFRALCLTDKGKHNNFAEGDAVMRMFREVLEALRDLKVALGMHYLMTCALDVKELSDNGELMESSPKLTTYHVAEGLIQQFPDIFAIGPMTNGEKTAHRIQFLAGVSKTSKDAAGRIKRTINFHPRLTGVKTLPSTLPADLKEVIKLKGAKSE